jgi:hypothetical protein
MVGGGAIVDRAIQSTALSRSSETALVDTRPLSRFGIRLNCLLLHRPIDRPTGVCADG